MRRYRGLAYAPTTKKTYSSQLNSYLNFCNALGCVPYPVDDVMLCRYAAHLALRLKYTSIPGYLNIVRILHMECGLDNPLNDNYFLRTVMRGIKREKGDSVKRTLPMTADILLRIKRSLDFGKPKDVVLWCASLVAFFGMLRKSSLFPPTAGKFKADCYPTRGDIMRHSRGFMLKIKFSKTNQYKERTCDIPLPYFSDNPLCPATAIALLLTQSSLSKSPEAPLFCLPNGPLTAEGFVTLLREKLRSLGLSEKEYTGHSFRRGGATAYFAAGVPGEIIKTIGDWKSQTYQIYCEISNNVKFEMVKPLHETIMSSV